MKINNEIDKLAALISPELFAQKGSHYFWIKCVRDITLGLRTNAKTFFGEEADHENEGRKLKMLALAEVATALEDFGDVPPTFFDNCVAALREQKRLVRSLVRENL